jgi:DNA-binding transcriptional LysR family regulator
LDNRQLEVFSAVAREGSFTRAATELHLVQSAVSATIASLEADLGERLFHRTTRQVRPTAAGRALLPHATAILDGFRAARDAVEAVSGGLSGSVRIGYMTSVTLVDLPGLLGRFSSDYPAVTMHLAPDPSGTAGLAVALERGELDLAIFAAPAENYPHLRIDVLARSPIGLAVAANHPLAGRATVRLSEAVSERFVETPEGFGNRTVVDTEFRRRGLHREVQYETSDLNDVVALVANGLGVAFLPHYVVDGDERVRCLEVEDAALELTVSIGTVRGRVLSAAAARLATLIRGEAIGN